MTVTTPSQLVRERFELLRADGPGLTVPRQAELQAMLPEATVCERYLRREGVGVLDELPRKLERRLLRDDFDTLLYINAQGQRGLTLRVSRELLPWELICCFLDGEFFEAELAGSSVFLRFASFFADAGRCYSIDWLQELRELRRLLELRDLRPLYLGWLASALFDSDEWDVPEPAVPPGLGELPPALAALAAFLDVPVSAIIKAAEASDPLPGEAPERAPGEAVSVVLDEASRTPWLAALVDPRAANIVSLPSELLALPASFTGPRLTREVVQGVDADADLSPLPVLEAVLARDAASRQLTGAPAVRGAVSLSDDAAGLPLLAPEVTETLARVASTSARIQDSAARTRAFVFEVRLEELEEAPMRRFRLAAEDSLHDLHEAIQRAFGWAGYHLHEFFRVRGKTREPLIVSEDTSRRRSQLEAAMPLSDLFGRRGRSPKLLYWYDFGDDWWHRIEHLETVELPADVPARALLAAEGPDGLEDCGGSPGFERFVTLAQTGEDPWGSDSAESLRAWLGAWTPETPDWKTLELRFRS